MVVKTGVFILIVVAVIFFDFGSSSHSSESSSRENSSNSHSSDGSGKSHSGEDSNKGHSKNDDSNKSHSKTNDSSNSHSKPNANTDASNKGQPSTMTKKERSVNCIQEHDFAFVDCFRNIGIITTKNIPEMTNAEFKDFKCSLQNATISCFNIKDDVKCSDIDGPFQNLFSDITPNVHNKCNKTGIIKAMSIQFSI